MSRLVRSEVWRLMSRRLFRGLLLVMLIIVALVGAIVFVRALRDGNPVLYTTSVPLAMLIAGQPLFTLSVIVGASSVGAEWASGAMTTLLTWEPRRGRIHAAKVVAAALVAAVAALVLLVVVAQVLLPSGLTSGGSLGYSGAWFRSVSGLWVRAGALAALGAALGVGLGTLMRNSAGPVAAWLMFEFIASPLLGVWRPWLARWLPNANVRQFLRSDQVLGVTVGRFTPGFSTLRSGLVLAGYAACLAMVGYAAFRRRDVT